MRRRHAPALALALALALVPAAAAASDDPAGRDLAQLNAQRAQHGIPARIARNPDWSARCLRHIGYMAATGIVSHAEDPSQAAYSRAGHWAGANAVLVASGDPTSSGWTSAASPFEFAPLHLAQALAPALASAGVADAGGYACLTTWPGFTRPAPRLTRVVTYPGNGAGIYASESTREWPFTPAERLGLRNPTGPHLYAFAWGRRVGAAPPSVARASVTGPAGAVAIRVVDAWTRDVGAYLPDGAAIIIPVAPLSPGAAYRASVSFSDGSTHAWSFRALAGVRTAVPGPAAVQNPITVSAVPRGRRGATRRYAVSITGQSHRAGQPVRVRVGTAAATFRSDADRWFAGSLRVVVRRGATSVRVAVRDGQGAVASQRVRLRAA